jgi:hypothetical protein
MTTPNTGIPYVPEDTLDPAAGLNLALNVVDALLQTAVIDMDQTSPPGSPSDGDLHIVATSATGAWVGQDDNLARYVEEGDFWQFYAAGTQVHLILNKDDAGLYAWSGTAWVLAAGLADAPSDGTGYVRKDGAWEPESGGGGGTVDTIDPGTGIAVDATDPANPEVSLDSASIASLALADTAMQPGDGVSIVTEASTSTMDPATHAGLNRYIRCADDVTFDSAETYAAGEVYNIRATAGLDLIEDGVTLTPPAGGTLGLGAGMSVSVIMTSTTAADVIGQTVAA